MEFTNFLKGNSNGPCSQVLSQLLPKIFFFYYVQKNESLLVCKHICKRLAIDRVPDIIGQASNSPLAHQIYLLFFSAFLFFLFLLCESWWVCIPRRAFVMAPYAAACRRFLFIFISSGINNAFPYERVSPRTYPCQQSPTSPRPK